MSVILQAGPERSACNASIEPRPDRAAVSAVVVTRNRPALLARCLRAIAAQSVAVGSIVVVDDAGDCRLDDAIAAAPRARVLRLPSNQGPAAAMGIGIRAALDAGARHVWLMDDDGAPQTHDCLSDLLATSRRERSDITCPLVRDIARPDRLAFPIRSRGRTHFTAAALGEPTLIRGFAHLFNGALIASTTFERIGVPNPALFIRGDEVEFLLRARRQRLRIVTDTAVGFLHPSSYPEIQPILGGSFHAVVPLDARKQHCQYRNRGWIFSRYGMWSWLAADHVRYACYYLGQRRDGRAYAAWLRSTWLGVAGRIGPPAAPKRAPAIDEAA